MRPKPPPKPKPKPEAKETPTPPKPEKPKPRLKPAEVAKLLHDAKPDAPAEGDVADRPQKAVKPKSGAEGHQRHKFDAASISDMLSHEAPQRRASRGREASHEAAAGAPTGAAPKLSTLLQGRIDAYTIEHYGRCWRAALSLNAMRYVPKVEFRLSRRRPKARRNCSILPRPDRTGARANRRWRPCAAAAAPCRSRRIRALLRLLACHGTRHERGHVMHAQDAP